MVKIQLNPKLPPSCPVDGEQECNGEFFRLGNKKKHVGDVIVATDEKLPVENSKHMNKPEICESWAYSMNSDMQELQRAQTEFGIMPDKCIYRFELQPGDGMMHNSPSGIMGKSHHDWWPANGAVVNGIVVQDGKAAGAWK